MKLIKIAEGKGAKWHTFHSYQAPWSHEFRRIVSTAIPRCQRWSYFVVSEGEGPEPTCEKCKAVLRKRGNQDEN